VARPRSSPAGALAVPATTHAAPGIAVTHNWRISWAHLSALKSRIGDDPPRIREYAAEHPHGISDAVGSGGVRLKNRGKAQGCRLR